MAEKLDQTEELLASLKSNHELALNMQKYTKMLGNLWYLNIFVGVIAILILLSLMGYI